MTNSPRVGRVTDPRTPSNGSGPRAADGRVAGRRGQATRQRLLDATSTAVAEGRYRDLTVVDISRRAETSPATFYQYFPDIESAVLSLLDELTDSGGQQLRALVTEASWDGDAASKDLAAGFMAFFARHGNLLRVCDLAALEGDDRFRQLRTRLFNGVFLALQDLAHEARAAGTIPAESSPGAIASVLTTMLAHVSAHQPGFEAWGVSPAALSETMASVIERSLRWD